MNKSISVVIPNYNGCKLLEKNLPTVFKALETSEIDDYEIIIADDASTDNSVEFIKNNYPNIKIIENKFNKGFAGNTNSGIYASTKDLVLILNSDVQLTEKYFKPLLAYFDDELSFGVMSTIVSMDKKIIQDGAKFPDYYFIKIGSTKNYLVKNKKSLYTFFLSGANALIDREKLLKVGCFKEIFNPYYGEDVDLGLTAWEYGYKLYYDSSVECYHPNSETIKNEPSQKVKLISKRNKFFLYYLHLNSFEFSIYFFLITLKSILNILVLDFIYIKSLFHFFKSITELKVIKKNLLLNKKHSIRVIKKMILNDIKNHNIIKF